MGQSGFYIRVPSRREGDSVNALEVAAALRAAGVDEVSIMFSSRDPRNSILRIEEARSAGLSIRSYSFMRSFRAEVRSSGVTHFFNFTGGDLRGSIYSAKWPHRWRFGNYMVINHVVFQNYEPHGDIYAYVSDWLADWARGSSVAKHRTLATRLRYPTLGVGSIVGSLPHAVSILAGDGVGFRKAHGVPTDAFVLGRIGGFDQFDDKVAQASVIKWLGSSDVHWFVAANTPAFVHHPRAVFLPALSRAKVHDFFSAINVQINGRKMGESFGLAIVEGLQHGVPTIAPDVCRNSRMDQHHIELLRPLGWLYCTENDIARLLAGFEATDMTGRAADLVKDRFTQTNFQERLADLLQQAERAARQPDKRWVDGRLTNLERFVNYSRSTSLWPATFGLACCAIDPSSRHERNE